MHGRDPTLQVCTDPLPNYDTWALHLSFLCRCSCKSCTIILLQWCTHVRIAVLSGLFGTSRPWGSWLCMRNQGSTFLVLVDSSMNSHWKFSWKWINLPLSLYVCKRAEIRGEAGDLHLLCNAIAAHRVLFISLAKEHLQCLLNGFPPLLVPCRAFQFLIWWAIHKQVPNVRWGFRLFN